MQCNVKVHIFWEGHKILRNLPLTFDCMYCSQKLGEDFAKILWPSQNIWTLKLETFETIFTCWSSNGWVTCESHSLTSVSGCIPNLNPNGSRLKKCLIKNSLTCDKSSDLRVSKTKDIMNAVVIWRNFLHFFYYCCGLSLDFAVLEWAWCSCSRFLASVLSSRTNVTSVVELECCNCGVHRLQLDQTKKVYYLQVI